MPRASTPKAVAYGSRGSRSAPPVTVPPHTRRRRPSQIGLAYIVVIAEQIVFHESPFQQSIEMVDRMGTLLRRPSASMRFDCVSVGALRDPRLPYRDGLRRRQRTPGTRNATFGIRIPSPHFSIGCATRPTATHGYMRRPSASVLSAFVNRCRRHHRW